MVELTPHEKHMLVQLCIGKASIAGANRNNSRENRLYAEATKWEERRRFQKTIADKVNQEGQKAGTVELLPEEREELRQGCLIRAALCFDTLADGHAFWSGLAEKLE